MDLTALLHQQRELNQLIKAAQANEIETLKKAAYDNTIHKLTEHVTIMSNEHIDELVAQHREELMQRLNKEVDDYKNDLIDDKILATEFIHTHSTYNKDECFHSCKLTPSSDYTSNSVDIVCKWCNMYVGTLYTRKNVFWNDDLSHIIMSQDDINQLINDYGSSR